MPYRVELWIQDPKDQIKLLLDASNLDEDIIQQLFEMFR